MRSLLSVFSLLILFSMLPAQTPPKKFSVRWRLSYNSFSMNDLKDYNTNIRNYYHNHKIDLQTTDNFPDYFGILGEFYFNSLNPPYGFFIEHTSTGSRLAYRDYSGRLTVDILVRRFSAGLFTEKEIWYKNTFSLLASVHISVFQSQLVLKEDLRIGDYSNIEHLKFIGYGLGFEPNMILRKKMGLFLISLNLGYQLDMPIFDLKESETGKKLSHSNNYVNPQWKGLRSGVSVGIDF